MCTLLAVALLLPFYTLLSLLLDHVLQLDNILAHIIIIHVHISWKTLGCTPRALAAAAAAAAAAAGAGGLPCLWQSHICICLRVCAHVHTPSPVMLLYWASQRIDKPCAGHVEARHLTIVSPPCVPVAPETEVGEPSYPHTLSLFQPLERARLQTDYTQGGIRVVELD